MASEQDVRLPLHVTSKQISVFAEIDTVDEASDINGVEDSSLLHCLVLFISLKVSSRFQL